MTQDNGLSDFQISLKSISEFLPQFAVIITAASFLCSWVFNYAFIRTLQFRTIGLVSPSDILGSGIYWLPGIAVSILIFGPALWQLRKLNLSVRRHSGRAFGYRTLGLIISATVPALSITLPWDACLTVLLFLILASATGALAIFVRNNNSSRQIRVLVDLSVAVAFLTFIAALGGTIMSVDARDDPKPNAEITLKDGKISARVIRYMDKVVIFRDAKTKRIEIVPWEEVIGMEVINSEKPHDYLICEVAIALRMNLDIIAPVNCD